jgi:diguanylate cyclase (GGDEF)-like protein
VRILLVEDARSVVMVMTSRLKSYGYEVHHAENGQRAVEEFQSVDFDLVLMDIEMPVMNGFVAASKIRAFEATREWAWTPIIFLTSSDTVQNLTMAIEAGGDDFMSKFVPEPVLQAKMKAMSRIANLRQRLSSANTKLQNIADLDGLTGLLNRRCMDRKVDSHWLDCSREGAPFALLMLDIDNFKKYNDHYGHLSGDDCLRRVAMAIDHAAQATNREGLTANAFAARYGGEEFAVTIPHASKEAYEDLSQRIVKAVSTLAIPHEKNNDWGVTTISVGGNWLESANGELKNVFRQADQRLYVAKERGRNRAEI